MVNIKTAAVICEFNPFHNGHKYLIEQIKKNHADRIICIMSGNFVQRGDVSITDKYSKCETAIMHGADAVIELPCVYANSNAQTFAENGVRIAKALKCDMLCFGIQDSSISEMNNLISLMESSAVKERIKESLKSGNSYPKALNDSLDPENTHLSSVLKDPNNILAIEYIKACRDTDIIPEGIQRVKVKHDSDTPEDNMASASYIRKLISSQEPSYRKYTDTFIKSPASLKNIKNIIVYRLKCMTIEDISILPEITEGIENRIYKAVSEYNDFDKITESIKTKRYTMSKIRRIMISALLGITDSMQKTPCPYIRILGLKNGREPDLSKSELPLICNVKKDREKLSKQSKKILDTDILSSRIYPLATSDRNLEINDFTKGIIRK